MAKIIGRKSEQTLLSKLYLSKVAEFVALYGRRRVGKTYLIKQFFKDKNCIFLYLVGIKNGTTSNQLENFSKSLSNAFMPGIDFSPQKNWHKAFAQLTELVTKIPKSKKIVLFFDELPWLAVRRSNLLSTLDYYWNQYWQHQENIKLIVCGSSASWMLNKIIHNKDGLYNRITQLIHLHPFSLKETYDFLKQGGFKFGKNQVTEIYLATGGIPHYLNFVSPELSAIQNIHKLCFAKNGKLKAEYNKLFASLFDSADVHQDIVKHIASHRKGISRKNLLKLSKFSQDGGRLTKRLEELAASDIIEIIEPNQNKKGLFYRIIDEYTLFYLYWISPVLNKQVGPSYWQRCATSNAYHAWVGNAFEALCKKHIPQIQKALNIPDDFIAYSWYHTATSPKERGAQIDLIFDRGDNVVTLCEIKYTENPFCLTKEIYHNLLNKAQIFKKITHYKGDIQFALITKSGIKKTVYSEEIISNHCRLTDFFIT